MIEKDAKRYNDFCHFIEGSGSFSPWLDDYDPFTEDGFAFVHTGSEDNGQFGLGDLDLYFKNTDFSYQDILKKVQAYRDECKQSMDSDVPEEVEYVASLDDLVRDIQDWCDKDESKKSEKTYDRPVTLYVTTRYDDAEEAQNFLDSIGGGEVKVSKERNGDTLSVSIEGADDAIDTFLAVYKDNYDTLEKDCDADVNGWTDPVDLKYYTAQGRKELTGESHKKSEDFKNFTLKQLRYQLKNGWAKDLTNASDEEIQAIIDSGHEISGVSNGTYGMNGLKVTYSNPDGSIGSGVVIGRTPNLFALLSPQKPKKTGVAPKPSESKKSEGVGGKIKMGIDYNMFMRMCASAAYLDENEDYWDALWEYYSEMGEIEDACEFFDNLFQYTSWCDEDEVYDEYLDDSYKDGTKSKAECIEAAVDAGDLDVFKTDKGYLVIQ